MKSKILDLQYTEHNRILISLGKYKNITPILTTSQSTSKINNLINRDFYKAFKFEDSKTKEYKSNRNGTFITLNPFPDLPDIRPNHPYNKPYLEKNQSINKKYNLFKSQSVKTIKQ